MQQVQILKIVVASPGDVKAERETLEEVVAELNQGIVADRGLRLELARWETDTHPGFHAEGPQGLIDPMLKIEDCDILIGIFWKRFGTPTKGAQSGTEYEIRMAHEAWKKTGSPQILVYFNQQSYTPQTPKEAEQWAKVLTFRDNFPEEGLWWPYNGVREFQDAVRKHLTQYIRHQYPLLQTMPAPVVGFAPARPAHPARFTEEQIRDLLPYLPDREGLLYQLGLAIKEQRTRPSDPLVCIIHGDDAQCQDKLVQRLQEIELPSVLELNDRQGRVKVYYPQWPGEYQNTEDFHKRLTYALAKEVLPMASNQEIHDQFVAWPAPVMICFQVLASNWKDYKEKRIIEDYIAFWQHWPRRLTTPRRILVFLFIKYQRHEDTHLLSYFKRRRAETLSRTIKQTLGQYAGKDFENIVFRVLPMLKEIDQQDVEDWARAYGCLSSEVIKELFRRYERETGRTSMPMEVISKKLQALLAQHQHVPGGMA